jgi:hypothetical protein
MGQNQQIEELNRQTEQLITRLERLETVYE